MVTEKEADRIRHVCDLLYRATQPVRILSHVSWDADVRTQFFKKSGRELPVVSYPLFDKSLTTEIIAEARRHIKDSCVDAWFSRQATYIENSAAMLSACGTRDFFRLSSELYGTPLDVLPDESTTSYALAVRFDKQIQSVSHIDLGAPPPACHLAGTVADDMR